MSTLTATTTTDKNLKKAKKQSGFFKLFSNKAEAAPVPASLNDELSLVDFFATTPTIQSEPLFTHPFWTPSRFARIDATNQANDKALALMDGPDSASRVKELEKVLQGLQTRLGALDATIVAKPNQPLRVVNAPPPPAVIIAAPLPSPAPAAAIPPPTLQIIVVPPESPAPASSVEHPAEIELTSTHPTTILAVDSKPKPKPKKTTKKARVLKASPEEVAAAEQKKASEKRMEQAEASVAAIRELMAAKKSRGPAVAAVAAKVVEKTKKVEARKSAPRKIVEEIDTAAVKRTAAAVLHHKAFVARYAGCSNAPPCPPPTIPLPALPSIGLNKHAKSTHCSLPPPLPCPSIPLPSLPTAEDPRPADRLPRLRPLLCSTDASKSIVFNPNVLIPKMSCSPPGPTSTSTHKSSQSIASSRSSRSSGSSILSHSSSCFSGTSTGSSTTTLASTASSSPPTNKLKPLLLSSRASIAYRSPAQTVPPTSWRYPPSSSKPRLPRSESDLSTMSTDEEIDEILEKLLEPVKQIATVA